MAFVRWSGVRPLLDALRRHCEAGKPLRVLTTTYTNSTEQRALDELRAARRARSRSRTTPSSTRLHAKAWLFHRESGYSTAYIGSSNLTHSAQVLGLEWNVRVSAARNPDVVEKMAAVFDELLGERRLRPLRPRRVRAAHAGARGRGRHAAQPDRARAAAVPGALLEQIELARHQGHHRNLLVAATGTGKTVMAAVDYARLRDELGREPAAVRRAPRGDPRPEPRDVPARAARRALRRDVGRRAAADALRARLRVDPEPAPRRRSRTSTRRTSTSSSSTSSTTPRRRRTRRCSSTCSRSSCSA